jgi:hypothetical protein
MSAKPAGVDEIHAQHVLDASLVIRESSLRPVPPRPSREALPISKPILAEFKLRRSAVA